MSLINRMLEDLDARNSGDAQGRRGRLSRGRGRERLPWIIAGASLLLATAMGAAWFLQRDQVPDETVTPESSAALAAENESARTNGTATEPSRSEVSRDADPVANDANQKEMTIVPDGAPSIAEVQQAEVQGAKAPPEAGPTVETAPSKTAPPTDTVEDDNTAGPVAAMEDSVARPVAKETSTPAPAPADIQADNDEGGLEVTRHLPSPEEAARNQINEGLRAMRAQRFELAAARLAAGLDVLPEDDQAREALYVAYRRQGRLAEAEGVLRDGLAVADEPARFAKLLARELTARDARGDALKVLAIDIPPVTKDPEYHALRGALLQQEARYAEALPVYEGLVKYYPDNGTWLAGLAMAQEQTGNPDAAVASYRRALRAGGLTATVNDYVKSRLAALDAADATGE